jgi:hypothetical protein
MVQTTHDVDAEAVARSLRHGRGRSIPRNVLGSA